MSMGSQLMWSILIENKMMVMKHRVWEEARRRCCRTWSPRLLILGLDYWQSKVPTRKAMEATFTRIHREAVHGKKEEVSHSWSWRPMLQKERDSSRVSEVKNQGNSTKSILAALVRNQLGLQDELRTKTTAECSQEENEEIQTWDAIPTRNMWTQTPASSMRIFQESIWTTIGTERQ